MPKDHKKRGRRAEAQKRKIDDLEEDHEATNKRPKTADDTNGDMILLDEGHTEGVDLPANDWAEPEFYGLLDEQEQEYFKRADDMLEADRFTEPEERTLFLSNVYKEAAGKELKLACSQSCSRLLERLILLSSPSQLKKLFQSFSGQYVFIRPER